MKHIDFYLDFISPYAYLAFEKLPEVLDGISYSVTHKPILLSSLLMHHGQLGPAEIAPKRDWTYRHVLWLAHSLNIPLQLPSAHPFNPLPLLRLAMASATPGAVPAASPISQNLSPASNNWSPNRFAIETIFRHVWQGGADPNDPQRLATLMEELQPRRDMSDNEVKVQLKANSDEALAKKLFGVPTFVVDDKQFWGLDSLPMLVAYLRGDAWFDSPNWDAAAKLPIGIQRAIKPG